MVAEDMELVVLYDYRAELTHHLVPARKRRLEILEKIPQRRRPETTAIEERSRHGYEAVCRPVDAAAMRMNGLGREDGMRGGPHFDKTGVAVPFKLVARRSQPVVVGARSV
jgi:hypothetical protein